MTYFGGMPKHDEKLPVTGVVVARDEADRIGRCVASLVPICSEVIVLDSGSTDDTVAIARGFGAKETGLRSDECLHAGRGFGIAVGGIAAAARTEDHRVARRLGQAGETVVVHGRALAGERHSKRAGLVRP